jgi:uncharacterized protein YcbK (DUF882 family)
MLTGQHTLDDMDAATRAKHTTRVVQNLENSRHLQKHKAYRSTVICTCGYRDPDVANSFITKPMAETSAKEHALKTGHTFVG